MAAVGSAWGEQQRNQQRRAPAGNDYQQRSGELQHSLRESERKRLELERKLFECSQSNRTISHLKYVKLTNSLKEICEWEKKARRRNQEILEEFDRIEAHAMSLKTSTDKLQRMKSEYEKYMKRMLPAWKKSAQTTSDHKEHYIGQMLQVGKEAGINMNLSRGSYHPATIFMSRQMSANSSIEHYSAQHKSSQPTKSFSISDPNSCRQAAKSSNVTDSYVIQTNSDIQCLNKSDKIDGKTSLQISKKASLASGISSEHGKTCSTDIESVTSNRSHSVEDERSAELNCKLPERLSPENRVKNLKYYSPSRKGEEAFVHKNPVINEERFELCCPSEFLPGMLDSFSEQSSDKPAAWEGNNQGVEGLWPIRSTNDLDNESSDSSSDLTISVSETDDIETPAKPPVDVQHPETIPEVGQPVHAEHEKEVDSSILSPRNLDAGPASGLEINQVCLSEGGLFHLLQSVEEMVNQPGIEYLELYQNTTLSATKLKELISLCNQEMTLKEENLETCTAVVLHQFQRLLQSTLNRPLLPEGMLVDSGSSTDGNPKRFCSLFDSSSIRQRLYKHGLFLKDHHLLHRTSMAEMLTSLLSAGNDENSTKTALLLKKVLTEESEEVSSIRSHGSSCSLLSLLNDNSEVKHTKPVLLLDNRRTREQEVSGWHEDERQEESLLEQIPITGKDTYPFAEESTVGERIIITEEGHKEEISNDVSELEQPVPGPTALQVPIAMVQKSKNLTEEGNQTESTSDASALEKPPGLISATHNGRARTHSKICSETSVSSNERSPVSRSEDKKKVVTLAKSKAFWGESDDSTSDIEAVLLPHNQNTDGDDFDDFYD